MDTKQHILVSAQRLVQQRGFNGFSYADIANEVGIRKASLHHHFATKMDLGVAVIDDYSAHLEVELARISGLAVREDEKVRLYTQLFRGSLEVGRMCLGGMLASEWLTLDVAMLPGIKRFFAINIAWLTDILTQGVSGQVFVLKGAVDDYARLILETMQGALLVARTTGNSEGFDRTVSLMMSCMRKD